MESKDIVSASPETTLTKDEAVFLVSVLSNLTIKPADPQSAALVQMVQSVLVKLEKTINGR